MEVATCCKIWPRVVSAVALVVELVREATATVQQ